MGFQKNASVVKGTVRDFIKKSSYRKETYDILFIDPPYHSEEINDVLPMIGEKGLLRDDGIIVVEHFVKKKVPETVHALEMVRHYRYGDTMLTIYRRGTQ